MKGGEEKGAARSAAPFGPSPPLPHHNDGREVQQGGVDPPTYLWQATHLGPPPPLVQIYIRIGHNMTLVSILKQQQW